MNYEDYKAVKIFSDISCAQMCFGNKHADVYIGEQRKTDGKTNSWVEKYGRKRCEKFYKLQSNRAK